MPRNTRNSLSRSILEEHDRIISSMKKFSGGANCNIAKKEDGIINQSNVSSSSSGSTSGIPPELEPWTIEGHPDDDNNSVVSSSSVPNIGASIGVSKEGRSASVGHIEKGKEEDEISDDASVLNELADVDEGIEVREECHLGSDASGKRYQKYYDDLKNWLKINDKELENVLKLGIGVTVTVTNNIEFLTEVYGSSNNSYNNQINSNHSYKQVILMVILEIIVIELNVGNYYG